MLMNMRVKFTKENYLRYISHLDLMRLFQRAFKRANIPIKYSQGFNPQPKLSIANPLALGIESSEEFMDIELYERIPESKFIDLMNRELPEGIRILDAKYFDGIKSISSIISWSYYEIKVRIKNLKDIDFLDILIKEWLNKDEIIIKKEKIKGNKIVQQDRNIRPLIGNVIISMDKTYKVKDDEYMVTINCLLKSGENGNLKPIDFLKGMCKYLNLDMDTDLADIKRLNMFAEIDGKIESPM